MHWIELPEHDTRKFPAVERCIYCESAERLGDEHIFPYGLGGRWVIPNGSCHEYLESRQEGLRHAVELFEKRLADDDPFAILNFSLSFANRELEMVRHYARNAGVPEEGLTHATTQFWNWERNREQPFGRILAYLFASLAAQFKAGRTKAPSAGFLNDINAIAAYSPYVDAMLIDNECAELLRYGRCLKELAYKASIFSLNTASEFIDYLRSVIAGTPDEVRREASTLYRLRLR